MHVVAFKPLKLRDLRSFRNQKRKLKYPMRPSTRRSQSEKSVLVPIARAITQ